MQIELEYPHGCFKHYDVALYDAQTECYVHPSDADSVLRAHGYNPGNPYTVKKLERHNERLRKENVALLERINVFKKVINSIKFFIKELDNVEEKEEAGANSFG